MSNNNQQKKQKKKVKKDAAYFIALTVMIVSIVALVGYVALYMLDLYKLKEESSRFDELRKQVMANFQTPTPSPTPTDTPTPTPSNTPTPEPTLAPLATPTETPSPTPTNTPTPTPSPTPAMLPGTEIYLNENADYVGYLNIPDTTIDYPVVMDKEEHDDGFYYLTHTFFNEENRNGAIFTIRQCEVGIGSAENNYSNGVKPTMNIIIFGHNMRTGAMFGNLSKFLKQSYYESHKYIFFETRYEVRTYEVIAAFRSHAEEETDTTEFQYYRFYDAADKADFDYWYENIMALNEIKTTATAKYGDEFLTLSTCSGTNEIGASYGSGRFALIAVRIK